MLQGKVALVTGASRGIGKAIALTLAEHGANVAINYAGSEQRAHEVARQAAESGVETLVVQADVSDSAQVEAMVKQVIDRFGRIDILVNNAGITKDNLLMRMKEEEFDQVININLKGVFHCLKAVSRQMMRQKSGTIINITSVVGVLGNVGQANYVAAKAGVIGLTKTAARELAPRGIRVNAVAPGFIETEMTADLKPEIREQMLQGIPLSTFGKPDDIAGVVAFLASDAAAYMTGQTLHVDGGMYMG